MHKFIDTYILALYLAHHIPLPRPYMHAYIHTYMHAGSARSSSSITKTSIMCIHMHMCVHGHIRSSRESVIFASRFLDLSYMLAHARMCLHTYTCIQCLHTCTCIHATVRLLSWCDRCTPCLYYRFRSNNDLICYLSPIRRCLYVQVFDLLSESDQALLICEVCDILSESDQALLIRASMWYTVWVRSGVAYMCSPHVHLSLYIVLHFLYMSFKGVSQLL